MTMTARKGAVTRKQKGLIKRARKESETVLQKAKDAPKKSQLDKAIDYFSLGFDSYQISVLLDLPEEKLEKWCKDFPKLEAARKRKTLQHDAEVRQAVLDLALGKCEVRIEEQLLSTAGKPKYTRITKSSVKPELNACREWLDMNNDDAKTNDMHISISFDGEDE